MPSIEFTVQGTPIAKGSTRTYINQYTGKPNTTSTAKGLAHWENMIKDRATMAMGQSDFMKAADLIHRPWTGPINVKIYFFLRKPKSAPKKKRVWPDKRPDLDKLVRAVLDAMTGIVFEDDSQVVQLFAEKDYGVPGVGIKVDGGESE